MKIVKAEYSYKVYQDLEEMKPADKELVLLAVDQLSKAYAPYSNFQVGAAVRTIDNNLYLGCNQENASYPLCICGERVALYNAGVNQPNTPIESLAITIKNLNARIEKPVSPCGACRQVISEFENRHNHKIRILLKSDGPEVYEIDSIEDLLPLDFNGSVL
jgi:cytidine deaminase